MQKTQLFAALRQLVQQGKSIIFVSHKLEDVEELCDEVTVLRRGKLIGTAKIPCPPSQLVEMIFGRELAVPNKPATARDDIGLQLDNALVRASTFDLKIDHLGVKHGEVIGLAGLEGSGQQEFLLACSGVNKLGHGHLKLQSNDMANRPYHAFMDVGVCYLPADRLKDGLVAGLTIRDHVALRTKSPSPL